MAGFPPSSPNPFAMSELHPQHRGADHHEGWVRQRRAGRGPVQTWVVDLLALAVIVTGMWAWCCVPKVLSNPPVTVDRSSPETTARGYLEYRIAGEDESARTLMWRPERFDTAQSDDSLRGATELEVGASWKDSAEHRPDEYRVLAEIRELEARYTTSRRDSVGTPPGRQMRFILLGREYADGPWFVLETGTGP